MVANGRTRRVAAFNCQEARVDESVRQQYLEAMGIQSWVARDPVPDAATTTVDTVSPAELPVEQLVPQEQLSAPTVQAATQQGDIAGLDWPALQARVEACRACSLHQTSTQTVFGTGNQSADLLIIGEAPGEDEDRQGEPFMGTAGQLLNAMLKAIGLNRSQVFITNILKCSPPENRDPHVDEVRSCEPFLQRQIELVRPKVILAMGRVASQNLLKTDVAVGGLRGSEHLLRGGNIPVVVTYHPAYLLRSPDQKGKAWQDLLRTKRLL
ncbi:MAG: uracil-DNA glycosylase [Gammaproteobacteria bacterium]|nr:uracil-DNA glycosylase [Gammaproteobacteria bacterium]